MGMTKQELQRRFGLSTATYVVIASMVGTGILVSPGYMMASLQNYPIIFGLWALGGLLALCGALCVAELAAALPRAGGEYVYLREAYGPMPAFLSGWTSFFLGFSAPLAVAGYIAALYLLTPFGVTQNETGHLIKIVAAIIIIAITLPNLMGHRHSAWTQNLTTIIKLGLFVALVIGAFLFGGGTLAHVSGGQPIGSIKLGTATTQLSCSPIAAGTQPATWRAKSGTRAKRSRGRCCWVPAWWWSCIWPSISPSPMRYRSPTWDLTTPSGSPSSQSRICSVHGRPASSPFCWD